MDRGLVEALVGAQPGAGSARIVSVFSRDGNGAFRYEAMSPAGLAALGLTADQVLGQPLAKVLRQRAQVELAEHVTQARSLPPGTAVAATDMIWTRDGLVRFDAMVSVHVIDGEELVMWAGGSSKSEPQRPRNQFEALFRSMPVPTYLWQVEGGDLVLVDANDAAYALSEGEVGRHLGLTATKLMAERPEVLDDLRRCHETGEVVTRVGSLRVATTGREHEMRATYVRMAPDLVLVSAEVLTDLKVAEHRAAAAAQRWQATAEDLAASEERYRTLVELAPDAIGIHIDGVIAFANPAAASLVGVPIEELVGRSVLDFVPSPAAEQLLGERYEVRAAGVTVERSIDKLRRADGTLVEVEVFAVAVMWGGRPAVQVVARDISQRTRMQRMEALGRMAGSIAHDFSNVLTAVMGYTSMAREIVPADHAVVEDLNGIERAVRPAVSMIHRLLAFSRREPADGHAIDLALHVDEAAEVLKRLIGPDIELQTARDHPVVAWADPGQIDLILLNLVTNARDAMPSGGRLQIVTGMAAEAEREEAGLPAGRYAALRVIDSGQGMDDATLARSFEPFFTTKPRGRGTGLGLASVYGAVQQSGGAVRAVSAPGAGTTVTVLLRMAEGRQRSTVRALGPGPGVSASPATGDLETVLLAEADPTIRTLVRRALEGAGYRVLTASDGVTAFSLALEQSAPIDLLVSDLAMAHLGGEALATFLTGRGRVRGVLYITSPVTSGDASPPSTASPPEVLRKPFRPDELLQAARRVLDDLRQGDR